MTVQEVVLKALSGEIHWFRAADILGMSARTLRRWRERYEPHGYVGLVDKRRHTPSVTPGSRRPWAAAGIPTIGSTRLGCTWALRTNISGSGRRCFLLFIDEPTPGPVGS